MDRSEMRDKALVAGGILTFRSLLGIIISVVGNVAIVRLLGLEIYGLQSVSAFVVAILTIISDLSIGLFLLRKPGDLSDEYVRTSFALIQVLAIAVFFGAVSLFGPLLAWWYGKPELFWLVSGGALAILISAWSKIPLVIIERQMNYAAISMVETAALSAYYLFASAGALGGLGIWALVFADLAKASTMSLLAYRTSSCWPRPYWDRAIVREILRYGTSMSASGALWALASGINPILIGKLVGLESAGVVRLAQAVVTQLSFFVGIIARLACNVLGRVQQDKEKVLRAVNEMALYHYFLVTFPLFLFTSVSYWFFPAVYGQDTIPAAQFMLFAVLPQAVNMVFAGQTNALMILGTGALFMKIHILRTVAVWMGALLLIPVVGYIALPVTELLSSFILVLLHKEMAHQYGLPNYRDPGILLVAGFSCVLAAWLVRIPVVSACAFLLGSIASLALISSEGRKTVIRPIKLAGGKVIEGLFPAAGHLPRG